MALFRARMASSSICQFLARSFSNAAPASSTLSSSGMMNPTFTLDVTSQVGSSMPLKMMRIGTLIHNLEMRPGQGPKLVRGWGTVAKIMTEPSSSSRYCEIKLPSGVKKLIDVRCWATIGQAPYSEHGSKKLYKAGQNRWRGIRPKVRGVAMNPVDHPHGGGEGKSKSSGSHGKGSRTPWGKPTKCGYKTGPLKRKK
nr:60S ribosomal protein L2, mitochondrial [Ipomoea batatas]